MTTSAPPTAEELLEEHENTLLRIKKRYYFLSAFAQKLNERGGGYRFEIPNDTVYQCVMDCYDMLAIDLASLCRGMVGKGGFFRRLNNHLAELKLASPKHVESPKGVIHYSGHQPTPQEQAETEEQIRSEYVTMYLGYNAEAFYRLFPAAKDRAEKKITQEDVTSLKDRFYELSKELISDRDGNRAHRFENPRKNRSAGQVRQMSIPRIGEIFEQIQRILNDIRLITNHSSLAYNDMNSCSVEETSKDLIDMVLLGTSFQILHNFGITNRLKKAGEPFPYQLRDQFYAKLPEEVYKAHAFLSKKIVDEYRQHGDYNKIKFPEISINQFKPKVDVVWPEPPQPKLSLWRRVLSAFRHCSKCRSKLW